MTQDPPNPPSHDTAPSAATSSPKPRRKWLKTLAKFGLGLIVLSSLIPTLLTWFGATSMLRSNLSSSLQTDVELESFSLGWLSGIAVKGLTIQNPPGFPTQPAIQLANLAGDVSFFKLLGGKIDLSGEVADLEIHAIQKADGSLNLEQLGKKDDATESVPPEDQPEESDAPSSTEKKDLSGILSRLRLDMALTNATVIVEHETDGTIERIRNLNATIKKPFGSSDLRLDLAADLGADEKPGSVELQADVDGTLSRPIHVHFACQSLDLGRYRPLLMSRMPDQIEEFAGIVEGEIMAKVDLSEQPKTDILLDGELRVLEPRMSGELFKGMTIHAPQWTFRPGITAKLRGDQQPEIDTSGLSIDLGFANVTGIDSEATEKLCGGMGFGAAFGLDLAKLTKFGGAVPKELEAENVKLDGAIALRADGGEIPMEVDALLKAIGLDAKLEAGHLSLAERIVEDLVTDIHVGEGKVSVATRDGAKVDGGALALNVQADLTDLTSKPATVSLRLTGANLQGGSAIEGLRFVIPILAGIAPDAAGVDFRSTGTVALDLSGPPMPSEGEDTFAWLEKWQGSGDVGLQNGSFTPSAAISGLLSALGQRQKLSYDTLATAFQIDTGAFKTDAIRFLSGGREIGLKGETTLRGAIDYSLDVAKLLKGHRDGERILKTLDAAQLDAGLTGTLTAPKLKLPNIEDLIKNAAGNAVQGALNKGLEKLDGKLRDKAPKELRGVLDGLFGGKKKKKPKDG